MDEKTIELGIISTTPTDEGVATTGHGTGLSGAPGFRKLTEAEVAECVGLLSLSPRPELTALLVHSYLQL